MAFQSTASLRDRSIWRILRNPMWRKLGPLCWWSPRLLPDKTEQEVKVNSGALEVSASGDRSPAATAQLRVELNGFGLPPNNHMG